MRLSEQLQDSLVEGKYPRLEGETAQRLDRMLGKLLDAEDKLKSVLFIPCCYGLVKACSLALSKLDLRHSKNV